MPGVSEHPGSIELSGADPARTTIADLLDRLGGVPADRVLLQPAPGTATESDLLNLPSDVQQLCELVDGTLVIKAMGAPESAISSCLMMFLAAYVLTRKLIVVLGPDGHTRYFGNQIRMPDVAVILRSRLPNGRLPDEQICPIAPDLAVEVLSPRNTPREIELKLRTCFDSGVRMAWVVDPRRRIVQSHTAPMNFTVLGEEDSLDTGGLLPGFSLSIHEWFEAAS